MLDELLTVPQAARALGVSRPALYGAIREGRLPAVHVLDRLALRRDDVEAYAIRTEGVGPKGGRPRRVRRKPGRPRKITGSGGASA